MYVYQHRFFCVMTKTTLVRTFNRFHTFRLAFVTEVTILILRIDGQLWSVVNWSFPGLVDQLKGCALPPLPRALSLAMACSFKEARSSASSASAWALRNL